MENLTPRADATLGDFVSAVPEKVCGDGISGAGNFCVVTAVGVGAIACVRISASPPFWLKLARFFPSVQVDLLQLRLQRIVYGRWGVPPQQEDVVVCRTGDATWEIHCHGGRAALARIVADLQEAGLTQLEWPEAVAQTEGTLEADWSQALARATTRPAAEMLLKQAPADWRTRWQQPSDRARETGDISPLLQLAEVALSWRVLGRHLTEPWRVVLLGRPNVGKSSLLNALVGYERAVVYDQPGTTRDIVTARTVCGGWPVELCDTAGQREAAEALEAAGIHRAREWGAQADLPLIVLDQSQPLTDDDRQLVDKFPAALLVANKADRATSWTWPAGWQGISVSSVTGAGLRDLQQALAHTLVPHLPPESVPLLFSSRLELTVEQLLQALRNGVWSEAEPCLNKLLS